MALQDTDNFIVSDTSGTNYKLSYASLLSKLQADGLGGGGGGSMNKVYRGSSTRVRLDHNLDIPTTAQYVHGAQEGKRQSASLNYVIQGEYPGLQFETLTNYSIDSASNASRFQGSGLDGGFKINANDISSTVNELQRMDVQIMYVS